MRRTRLHDEPTMLEIMDHVLDKGIVIVIERDRGGPRRRGLIDGVGLFGFDAHVEVVTGLDDALKRISSA